MALWHGIAHAPHAPHAQHAASDPDFGHDTDDEAQCRLYDQLGHADALCVAPLLAAEPPASGLPQRGEASPARGRSLRPYQARAPPLA